MNIHQKVIFAARSGNLELLKERVEAGGDVNYIDEKHGTALIEAIRSENQEVVNWLISKGANVNAEYSDDIGPLEISLKFPKEEIVKILVWAGARLRKKTRHYYADRLEACLKNG